MMLKSMRDAGEAAGEATSNETGMYEDMFDKQVALTLSKRQDLGIARLFERQLGDKTPAEIRRQTTRQTGTAGAIAIGAQTVAKNIFPNTRGRARPTHRRQFSEQAARLRAAGAADHSTSGRRCSA